ncbi:MAG: FxsA family protein [Gammaproteobacteria bacterium]|nr:FxsA family protein [Gammaproteobacteria bacterium]
MNVLHLLFLLFIAVPIVEIYLLLEVGGVIGAIPTIGLVVLTAVAGAALVRAQGFSTIMQVRRSMEAGEIPAVAIIEGIFLLVAGALLLTPGFLTDAVGFGCLIPPLRRALILRFIEMRVIRARHPGPAPRHGHVIEGEFKRED